MQIIKMFWSVWCEIRCLSWFFLNFIKKPTEYEYQPHVSLAMHPGEILCQPLTANTPQYPSSTFSEHLSSFRHRSLILLLNKSFKKKKENKTKLNAQNERNKSTKQKPNILEKVWLLWVSFTDKWRLDEWAHSSLKDSTFSFCGGGKKKGKKTHNPFC